MRVTSIPSESPPDYDIIASEIHHGERSGEGEDEQLIDRPSSPVSLSRSSMDSNESSGLYEAPSGRLAQTITQDNREGSRPRGHDIDVPYDQGNDDDDNYNDDNDDGINNVIREMEQMEILEPEDFRNDNSFSTRAAMASHRLAKKMNAKIITPIYKFIDPVVKVWINLSKGFDRVLSHYGNPLFLKRIMYLLIVTMGIGLALWFGILPSDGVENVIGQFEYSEDALMKFVRDELSVNDIQERYRYLSSMPHLAGTSGDLSLAKYVQDEFRSFGYSPIELNERNVYLTFPGYDGDIELTLKDGDDYHKANFREPDVHIDGKPSQRLALPVHGLSWPGEAEGHGIYANYGTKQDFKKLVDANVQIEGSIVFMKYGKLQPGLKITLAEQHGAKGVVLFSDSSSKDKPWPEGPDYADDAVQRAHVGITGLSPGDILTPGWPTSHKTQRARIDDIHTIAHIPSIPISWKEVEPFLKSMKGYGLRVDGKGWSSVAPKLDEWWTGSHDNEKKIKLRNNPVVESEHPIWNVLTKIDGSDQGEKAIIIGAPRDAWCFGAVDPVSGTGVLLELARIISRLQKVHGWAPRRSIYFASWDGSKQNLIGSTEWVEYHIKELRKSGAAYINLADAISGTDLRIDGHPILSRVLANALEIVHDPVSNDTLATTWGGKRMGQLRLDGDHLLFMSSSGMPSLDIGFKGDSAVPRDSCYDSIRWNERFGDPSFQYHSTLVELVASIVIQLSDHRILPFDTNAYAHYIKDHINDLREYAKEQPSWQENLLEFSSLDNSADILRASSQVFQQWYNEWTAITSDGFSESPIMSIHRWSWNSRLINLDKHLLLEQGAPGRGWLKHVIYGPQLWHPTEGNFQWMTFPVIRDYIEAGNWEFAQRQIDLTSQLMHAAFDKFIH